MESCAARWNFRATRQAAPSRARHCNCRKWLAGSMGARRARLLSYPIGSSASSPDMAGRRSVLALIVCLALPLSGCGWERLYADPETGPASADLRAIKVLPISERIGQRLEMALRNSLNPRGEPTP